MPGSTVRGREGEGAEGQRSERRINFSVGEEKEGKKDEPKGWNVGRMLRRNPLTEPRRACEHGMRFFPLSLPSCLLSSFPALIVFYRPSSLPFLVPPLSDYVRRYASVALFLDEEDKAGRSEREREAGRPTQSSPAPSAGVPRQHPHRGRQPSLSSSVVGGVGGGKQRGRCVRIWWGGGGN